MKEALTRLLVYIAIALMLMAIFNALPVAPQHWTLSGKFAYYLGAYSVPVAFLAVIGESAYLCASFIRRKKAADSAAESEIDASTDKKELMDEQPKLMDIYVDFLSNQPKDEINRQNAANRLRQQLESRLEPSIERGWELPQLIVNNPDREYLALLLEARQLYIDGYFYSCVAMCGIVNERLIKDTLRASVLIEKDGKVERPVGKVFNQLERVEIRALAEFIREAG